MNPGSPLEGNLQWVWFLSVSRSDRTFSEVPGVIFAQACMQGVQGFELASWTKGWSASVP